MTRMGDRVKRSCRLPSHLDDPMTRVGLNRLRKGDSRPSMHQSELLFVDGVSLHIDDQVLLLLVCSVGGCTLRRRCLPVLNHNPLLDV